MSFTAITQTSPFAGTSGDDAIIGTPATALDNVFSGGDGDDLIIGDATVTYYGDYSDYALGAYNLDNVAAWSRTDNPLIGNSTTVPHMTYMMNNTKASSATDFYSRDAGNWFKVTVGAGETITVDIDFGYTLDFGQATNLGNGDLDTNVYLTGLSDTTIYAESGDSPESYGGLGSTYTSGGNSYDPYLTYTNTSGTAQTYLIAVKSYVGGVAYGMPAGKSYIMNVSVTAHAVSANGYGNDLIDGGNGNDMLFGIDGNDTVRGGAGQDTIHGGTGVDTLYGDDGEDTIQGDAGDDTIRGGNGYDSISGGDGSDVIYGEADGDTIDGGADNDLIYGGDGSDRITGGTGADTMDGGAGDDYYYVDNVYDSVIEAGPSSDRDVIYASVNYSLEGGDAETLVLSGSAIYGYGNSIANTLYGHNGFNVLQGYSGNDQLYGLGGDDLLDGGIGRDLLTGGAGSDTYFVDDVYDNVVETAGAVGEVDTINAAVTYNLTGRDVEVLTLTGSADISGYGNDLAQTLNGNDGANMLFGYGGADMLVGNAGNDVLDGGAGVDAMVGGVGSDVYYVDNSADVVTELNGQGADIIFSTVAYTLAGRFVETLTLTGTANIAATGNSRANSLYGNAGNNSLLGLDGDDLLDGGSGADTLVGGTGNDNFYVDNASDNVVEDSGSGTDSIFSSVSYTLLGRYVETLILIGHDINAIGNSQSNTLVGSDGNNILRGGLGNDVLTGEEGLDTFGFDTALGATNVDRINDFSVADDTIRLSRAVFEAIGPNGTLDADTFRIGSFAVDAQDRIFYNSSTGGLFYDADGNGAGSAILFARLATGLAMTHADFLVIA